MRNLRAAATAFLLGTAAISVGAALQPALAATVSSAVGIPLNEARSLAAAKNYHAALEKVNAAAAAAKTSDERSAVDQMRNSIAISSGDTSTAGGAKAKFANDANAGKWRDVIADGGALDKTGGLDSTSRLIIAQAYYSLNDGKNCVAYIKRNGLGGEAALATLQACAYQAQDDDTQRYALEQLVTTTGKAEHWKSLLNLSERARGLKDHNTLDVFRIKWMTGTIDPSDIVLYVTFALQFKSPAEAKAVLDKALADKTIPADDRANRLTKTINDRLNAMNANFGQTLAAAQKAPKGDDLVAIGEYQIGAGKTKDAIDNIQAGIAKGMTDPGEGQIRLGAAYLAAGQKADAIKAFSAVKADDKEVMVAHLYSIYARSGAPAPATKAAAAPTKKKK